MTPAAWVRQFVLTHDDYRGDSVVSDSIATDLMQACHDIGTGALKVPELHGSFPIGEVLAKDAYAVPLPGATKATKTKSTLDLMANYQTQLRLAAKQRTLLQVESAKKAELALVQEQLKRVDQEMRLLHTQSVTPASNNGRRLGSPPFSRLMTPPRDGSASPGPRLRHSFSPA